MPLDEQLLALVAQMLDEYTNNLLLLTSYAELSLEERVARAVWKTVTHLWPPPTSKPSAA